MHSWKQSFKEGLTTSLPTNLLAFWSFHDGLAMEDGIIFKGKQVLISKILRADILAQLHKSHQGNQKTQLLARGVYWPNINNETRNDQYLHFVSRVGELQQEGAPHPTRHTDRPVEQNGLRPVRGRREAFSVDISLLLEVLL